MGAKKRPYPHYLFLQARKPGRSRPLPFALLHESLSAVKWQCQTRVRFPKFRWSSIRVLPSASA